MYSLLLDASIKKTFISINKKDVSIKKIFIDNSKIFLSIEDLLKQAKINIDDLSFVSTSIGPGSYTGIRIALSIAKSISFSKNIPIIGFYSLCGFIPKISTPFFSIMDAKSNRIYLLKGEKKDKKTIYNSNPILLPIEDIKNFLDKKYSILSPDFEILKKRIKNVKKSFIDENHLAKITFERFLNKKFNLIDPIYPSI